MDTAVVSGLRISTTKGIGSDATERAKKFLQEEREKERKYQRQKEKRNQKKNRLSSSPSTVGEGTMHTSAEQVREGSCSKTQPHACTRTPKKGRKKVAAITWGDDIVNVLQEELHIENVEDDATAATSTTTDTAGARTKLRPVEEGATGATKRNDDMAAASTACKSVWSIQSDATRVVDNRTTFAQTHFTRTV